MNKSTLIRFGVSIEDSLIRRFDGHIRGRKYRNRSEAIRDLIRDDLVREEWGGAKEVAGAVVFVYDHHQRSLSDRLTDLQHDLRLVIVSTQHTHLDHDNCLEVITVRGNAGKVRELFDGIRSLKGVKHAEIVRATTGAKPG